MKCTETRSVISQTHSTTKFFLIKDRGDSDPKVKVQVQQYKDTPLQVKSTVDTDASTSEQHFTVGAVK